MYWKLCSFASGAGMIQNCGGREPFGRLPHNNLMLVGVAAVF